MLYRGLVLFFLFPSSLLVLGLPLVLMLLLLLLHMLPMPSLLLLLLLLLLLQVVRISSENRFTGVYFVPSCCR